MARGGSQVKRTTTAERVTLHAVPHVAVHAVPPSPLALTSRAALTPCPYTPVSYTHLRAHETLMNL
eukprot:5600725-Prymnesium_polylepis.1